jgi:hypothetical protein
LESVLCCFSSNSDWANSKGNFSRSSGFEPVNPERALKGAAAVFNEKNYLKVFQTILE